MEAVIAILVFLFIGWFVWMMIKKMNWGHLWVLGQCYTATRKQQLAR